jgi:plastocyanin
MQRYFFVVALALSGAACEEKKTDAPAPPAAPTQAPAAPAAPAAAPAAGTGSEVTGRVVVKGKIPVMEDLKRNSDAFCAKKPMKDESVLADKAGNLANVIVRINGLPATPAPTDKVTISQDDCMYRPRVAGIVAGQPLDIRNGDPVLHNVHSYEGARTLFNVAQVPGTPNYEKKFDKNGTLIKLKCDVHQWMTGYVWVQNNSYFAVTDGEGKFTIKDVPAGTWAVEAWHERFGTKTGKLTVEKGKPATISFEYNGTETAAK